MALIGKRRRSPDDVLRAIDKQAGDFTAQDIITTLGWDAQKDVTFVGNWLRRYAERGVIEEAGKVESKGRGRRRLLWRKARTAPPTETTVESVSETEGQGEGN